MPVSSDIAGPTLEVVIASRAVEAEGIISLELAAASGGALPGFTAGAHVDVQVGPGLVRQYSLMNDPARTDRYRIGVLLEPNSRGGSAGVHAGLVAGKAVTISTPRNHFPLDETAGHSILIAGGIGVTPILAMAQRLTTIGADFTLHYCARTRARAAFLDLIAGSAFADRARTHFDDGEPGQYFSVDRDLTPRAGAHLYVCGPGGFMDFVTGGAKAQGWPAATIHVEYFSHAINEDGNRPFTIRLAKRGKELLVPADKSIAKVLKENGVAVPVSCEEGVCGTCLTDVLAGEPLHRDVYLSDEERASGKMMTVCCSRAKSDLLVLDL